MKEQYKMDHINETLGSNLDLDRAWSNFENKKRRRGAFVWLPIGLFFGVFVLGIWFLFHKAELRNRSISKNYINSTNQSQYENIEQQNNKKGGGVNITDKYVGQDALNSNEKKQDVIDKRSTLDIEKEESISSVTTRMQKEGSLIVQLGSIKLNKGDVTQLLDDRENTRSSENENATNTPNVIPSRIGISPLSFISHNILLDQVEYVPMTLRYIQARKLKESKKSNWIWGISHSIGFVQRSVDSDLEYDKLRDESENVLESNHFQFHVNKKIGNRFYLSTGLTVGQYRTKLTNQVQKVFSPVFYENSVLETLTQNGLTQEVLGTAVGSKTVIFQNIRYQRYQNIAIPIDLSMSVLEWNRWNINLGVGMEYSVLQRAKGSTIASTSPVADYVSLSELGYRSQGMVEGKYFLQGSRQITNDLHISFGYQGRQDLVSRRIGKYGQDKFRSHSLQLGLHMGF